MTGRHHAYLLAAALAAAGLGIFGYKHWGLGFPLRPDAESEIWTVQARVRFDAYGGPTKLELELPALSSGYTVLDEDFVSRGYGLDRRDEYEHRWASWAKREAEGEQTLYYRATLRQGVAEVPRSAEAMAPVHLEEPYQTAMLAMVDDVRARSADPASIATAIVRRINDPSPDENAALFLRDASSAAARAQVAVTILRGAGLAARLVHGIRLERPGPVEPEPWLEIDDGRRWFYVDPRDGGEALPENLLLWWRGELPMARVSGGSRPEVRLTTQPSRVPSLEIAERRAEQLGSRAVALSPLTLPIHAQAIYGVLLTIPIGALIIVILRNLIGIKTFGTFLPVLVALAFRETRLVTGILLFALVVGLGLAIRFYLEQLRLLLVPRLSAVLTTVVLLMLAISIIGYHLGLENGLSVALFPMVILTISIEHMSIVWEERGARDALIQGVGTLLVATVVFVVINLEPLQDLVFLYPELLLVLIAAMLVLGRYGGYRLLELARFRALLREAD